MRRLTRVIERGVRMILPLFFAVIGLSIGLGFLTDPGELAVLGLVVLVAVASKLGGTAVVARLAGMPWRESLGVGVMVNCRGLTELVVLTTGLTLGIVGEDLFVMFVLMTLLTTAATGPLLSLLHLDPARRAARGRRQFRLSARVSPAIAVLARIQPLTASSVPNTIWA